MEDELPFTILKDGYRQVFRVLLDPDDQDGAAAVGRKRHRTSETRGEHPAYGCKAKDAEAIHIIGSCCEWAAAKALGLTSPTHVDTHGEPDLPPDIQVRGTTWPKDRVVRIFKRDKPEQRYLLVHRVSGAVYHLTGWCPADFGQQKQFWGPAFKRPGSVDAWLVPEAELWSMATFDWAGRAALPVQPELLVTDFRW